MLQVGRDPETFLNKGIRLHCDKYLDRNAYVGFKKVNSTFTRTKILRRPVSASTPGTTCIFLRKAEH